MCKTPHYISVLKNKYNFRKKIYLSGISIIIGLFSVSCFSAPAILSNPVLADVTDRSFSLIWTTDQTGEMLVEIYSDQAGTQLVSNYNVSSYGIKTGSSIFPSVTTSTSKTVIEDSIKAKGIAKVVVSNLEPNTTYYLKYGITTDILQETTMCPDTGILYCLAATTDLLTVQTENTTTREINVSEVLLNDVILHLDASAEQGEMVLISIETANYPVSAIVGDVVPVPYAFLDLNNYFSMNTGESLLLRSKAATPQGNSSNVLNIVRYSGLGGSSNQYAILDQTQGFGSIAGTLSRNIGDCNADSTTDGYDNLLLSNYVADVFLSQSDEDISFHTFLCDLYAESGMNYTNTAVLIDASDLALHNDLMVGNQDSSTLPVVP